ncbi:sugar phosphate isomerase/epimerase family protein [Kitasatospora sp. NPDC059327]|uniref:sugar phosphate isomerase/epimerase family protein n=1 Tax=Kitasatospora sp. NPDC059327 TaxID=3346803 RepID=UPI0036BA05AF
MGRSGQDLGNDADLVEEVAGRGVGGRGHGREDPVRVFPRGGDGPATEADRRVRRLTAVADTAERLGVRILIETHDSHPTGQAVARLLHPLPHPTFGALWDLMHTVLAGESPAATRAALGPRLSHPQVKDLAGPDDRTPLPLGTGVLPVPAALRLLPPGGWACWEYEAAWHPSAAPLPPLPAAAAAYLTEQFRYATAPPT